MGDDAAKKKFEKEKAFAEKGDAKAQTSLGFMYQYGEGVLKDDKEAVKWFRKAAEQGNADAQHNMGLFYAWDATLRYEDSVARINLLLNRASPWLDIDSYLPFEGKVVLRNKQATEAFVRIPLWVDGDKISCTVRGEPVSWNWFGRYLHLRSIAPGDAIVLQFPVEERTETWTKPDHQSYLITAIPGGTKFDLRFRGNTVVEVTPPLMKDSPLYRNRLEQFSGEVAPMRTVTRQVTPLVLKW